MGLGPPPPHCRFALPPIYFIPASLTYSVPLFLKRQCGRTPGAGTGLGPPAPPRTPSALYQATTVLRQVRAPAAREAFELARTIQAGPCIPVGVQLP
jgi:hypothetical protein